MPKLAKLKASKSNFIDAVGIALIKTLEERLLAPIVGNGTFKSGIVKGVGAFILASVSNHKIANLGSTALMIDSAEDLVNAGLKYVNFGGPQESGMVL